MEDNDIWKKKFEGVSTKFPNEIAKEYCDKLYKLTQETVLAKVEKYNQSICIMNSNESEFSEVVKSATYNGLINKKNIQDYLGEGVENSKCTRFTFELFITGIKTSNYKYRFCFIEYGIYPYPMKIALDLDIANEIKCDTIITCSSEEEFKNILMEILNSDKITEVIQGLMTINN